MTESWINTNTQQSTHEEKRITRREDGNCQERAKRKDAVLLDTISSTGKPMAWLFYRHPKTCRNPLVLRTHPKNLWRARLSKRRSSFFFHIYLVFGHDLYHFQVFLWLLASTTSVRALDVHPKPFCMNCNDFIQRSITFCKRYKKCSLFSGISVWKFYIGANHSSSSSSFIVCDVCNWSDGKWRLCVHTLMHLSPRYYYPFDKYLTWTTKYIWKEDHFFLHLLTFLPCV